MDHNFSKFCKFIRIIIILLLYIFPLIICISAVYYLWNLYTNHVGNPFNFRILWGGDTPRSALGAFGDFMGGLLNPFLAFFSFLGVLWTVNENRKSQTFQKFENLFTNLISELSNKINYLYPDKLESLEKELFKHYQDNTDKRALVIKDRDFSALFIFLYQILKHIDTSLDNEKVKRKYASIVRSLVPDQILQILMINCYLETKEHNFHKYKKLIEKFSFFEHISFYHKGGILKTSLLLSISTAYNQSAFGQNESYLDFKKNPIFIEFIKKNNLSYIFKEMAMRSVSLKEIERVEATNPNFPNIIERSFRLLDGDNFPIIKCIYIKFTGIYKKINLNDDEITEYYVGSDYIKIFSKNYENGIKAIIEKDAGNVIFSSKSLYKDETPDPRENI